MRREEIDKRIDNEKRLRNEGYTNNEIAEIMCLPYQTVYRDIGKEPADFRASRKAGEAEALNGLKGTGTVSFPGSIKPKEEPKPEPDDGDSPFVRAWRNGENMHRAIQSAEKPHTSDATAKVERKSKIIADTLEKAVKRWSEVFEGDYLRRQPKVEDEKVFFDNANQPWLVIVYSEVV